MTTFVISTVGEYTGIAHQLSFELARHQEAEQDGLDYVIEVANDVGEVFASLSSVHGGTALGLLGIHPNTRRTLVRWLESVVFGGNTRHLPFATVIIEAPEKGVEGREKMKRRSYKVMRVVDSDGLPIYDFSPKKLFSV